MAGNICEEVSLKAKFVQLKEVEKVLKTFSPLIRVRVLYVAGRWYVRGAIAAGAGRVPIVLFCTLTSPESTPTMSASSIVPQKRALSDLTCASSKLSITVNSYLLHGRTL